MIRLAAALPALAITGVLAMTATAFDAVARHQADREARAAHAEHWAEGRLRPEREFGMSRDARWARLEMPEDRP